MIVFSSDTMDVFQMNIDKAQVLVSQNPSRTDQYTYNPVGTPMYGEFPLRESGTVPIRGTANVALHKRRVCCLRV